MTGRVLSVSRMVESEGEWGMRSEVADSLSALQGGEGCGEVGIFNFSSTIVPAIYNHTR